MKIASEILILVMLIMSNGRVFTTKKAKVDALVMLSPLAFLLASLNLFAFSIDIFSVLILLVSFLVLLSNFHALFRYSSRLIVDRYSPLMKVWAVATVTLSAIILGAAIYFRPVELNNNKLEIKETRIMLSGNFIGGFVEAEKLSVADAHIFEFAPNPKITNSSNSASPANENPVIIFMADKRGDTQNYKPYLQLLAQSGFVCYSGDFFAKDGKWLHTIEDSRILRRIGLVLRSLIDNQKYMSQREFYTYNFSREYVAMINLLDEKYGNEQKYFFVTDAMGFDAASDVSKKYPEKIAGIFDISTVDLYKTSGYGFVQQTDPLLALMLGVEKDKTLFNIKYAVMQTKNAVEAK